MSKIVTIWGSADSGKTTFSIKLAKELSKKHNVIVVFLDKVAPPMSPFLFDIDEKDKSLGKLLASEMIGQNEILKHVVSHHKYKNLGFIGLNQGEHTKSYPSASNDKYHKFIVNLSHMCDYVIFDLPNNFLNSNLSTMAMEQSDTVIRMCGSHIKAISYFKSNIGYLSRNMKLSLDDDIKILCKVDDSTNINLLEGFYGKTHFKLPATNEVRTQLEEGEVLTKELNSKKGVLYNKVIKKVISKINDDEENDDTSKKGKANMRKLHTTKNIKIHCAKILNKLKKGE